MLPGILFTIWRIFEIVTLIPIIGMLSWFVHGYTVSNQLTPNAILVLFIVSVIAGVWAVVTLFAYGATKYNASFVAVVDLLIFGALIAGVYYLRGITNADCANWGSGNSHDLFLSLGIFGSVGVQAQSPWALHINKNCAMLKASFALGIMNVIFFFVTFLILLMIHREHGTMVYSRRSRSRRHSRSPRRSYHSPRRSHHSTHTYTRREYV